MISKGMYNVQYLSILHIKRRPQANFWKNKFYSAYSRLCKVKGRKINPNLFFGVEKIRRRVEVVGN